MTTKAILCSLASLLLAASVQAAFDILPMAAGNRWEYERVKLVRATITFDGRAVAGVDDTSSGGCVYEIKSQDSSKTPVEYMYNETVKMRPTNGGPAEDETTDLRMTSDDTGLRILATTHDETGGKGPEKETYDPPLVYYLRDAVAGKAWEVGTLRDGDAKSFTKARGAARETVTVPAGTFKDCLKVVYSSDDISGSIDIWDKSFTVTGGKSRGIYWIADGVGVVKELEVATTVAEAPGPQGKPLKVEAATCTVSELKPGYKVGK